MSNHTNEYSNILQSDTTIWEKFWRVCWENWKSDHHFRRTQRGDVVIF